jgi:CO/xanthine dehydrogenase Mo-binding subunit
VEYELLPIIDDPELALQSDSPKLHTGGNVLHRTDYKQGDVEAGFEQCAHVVEEIYYTPRQMHAYMETEGGLFVPEPDGRLMVYASTQHGFKDRMQLARNLAVPEQEIRVVSSPIGGSFGGKDELTVQPYGALLAIKSGRPVKLHNSRKESVRASVKRHPMKITMKTGVDKEGRIIAHRVRIIADTGAYATLGSSILNFASEHAMGPYRMKHIDVEGISVYTNNGVSGEIRGFGGNQVTFALENQIDRLAEKLGKDPWEFRKINLRDRDEPGPFGQRVAKSDGAIQVWEAARQSELWAERLADTPSTANEPWIRRGIGSAMAIQGAGFGFGKPDPAGGKLSLNEEGQIEAAFSFEEIGQGVVSSLELILKDLLDCDTGDLRIVIGDTDLVQDGGTTTASRTTTMAWMSLHRLMPLFVGKLLETASSLTGLPFNF